LDSENIIAVNVPNVITITIMAVMGGFILGLIRMAIMNATGQSAS
jgi:hypothetical protein